MSGSTKVYQLEQVSAPRDLDHQVTGLCVCVGGVLLKGKGNSKVYL